MFFSICREGRLVSCSNNFFCEGAYQIFADARLDNRLELSEKLGLKLSNNLDSSDSFFILQAYLRWGVDCPQYLLGDFSFLIIDGLNQRIFAARDPMGVRSFYYTQQDATLFFSTNLSQILKQSAVKKDFNTQAFASYFSQTWLKDCAATDGTFFHNIYQLGAGSSLEFHASKIIKRKYWKPEPAFDGSFISEFDVIEQFQFLLQDAVEVRMRGVRSAAILLSGGLDSSPLGTLGIRVARKNKTLFAGVASCLPENYSGSAKDERYFIDQIARYENIPMHYVTPTGNPFEDLGSWIKKAAQPLIANPDVYGAMFNQIEQLKSEVVLDGCFGELGPSAHASGYLLNLLKNHQFFLCAQEVFLSAKRKKISMAAVVRSNIFGPLLKNKRLKIPPAFIGPALAGKINLKAQKDYFSLLGSLIQLGPNSRSIMLNQSADKQLFFADSTARVAYPYLDKRLLEFCLSLPASCFFQNGWNRYLIRVGTKNIMPESIRWRIDKKPFSPSYLDRLLQYSPEILDYISSFPLSHPARDFVDFSLVEKMIQCHIRKNSWRPSAGMDYARVVLPQVLNIIEFINQFSTMKLG